MRAPVRIAMTPGPRVCSMRRQAPRARTRTCSNQVLQTRLRVGRSDDPLEREAEAVAEKILRGEPAPGVTPSQHAMQRRCASCAADEDREIVRRQALASENDGAVVRRAGRPRAACSEAVAAVASDGRPLGPRERAYFEPRFGRDLSRVRVHADHRAASAAEAIDARAFTLGRHIAFAGGEYRPATPSGLRLLAHELTHVVQQGGDPSPATIRRQSGAGAGAETGAGLAPPTPSEQASGLSPPQPQPPTYGPSCSTGARNPCQYSRCGSRHPGIQADLTRAIGYVQQAIQALGATPLAADTIRALDWYFNDHGSTTASTARDRLVCIRDCLQSSQQNNTYGCDPDRADDALAYVCVGSTPVCTDRVTPICLTNSHFGTSPRVRAQTIIHECAHRVGMSLGRPQSVEDIYRHTARFSFLDTSEALLNSDSYALFAGAIREGVPISISLVEPSLTAGAAIPGRGEATWQARLYLGAELQHPVLGIFNPTLGLGFSVIGETTTGGPFPVTSETSMLASLLPGIRIGDPRPGAAGGGYVSFFGGPSLAVSTGRVELGAEAGMALGYRWRWLDVSAGVGYAYDPTREAGMENLFTVGASLTFLPFQATVPGQ